MPSEPVAIAFANTRSSRHRDRIATLAQWRAWVDTWPGLRPVGHAVDVEGLLALRATRDDVQLLLHSATGNGRRERGPAARLMELAHSPTNVDLRWRGGRLRLTVLRGANPATAIATHFACAALDLLLTGPPLSACRGQDCLKLFIASRSDRRWCDSAICGNRARVRDHYRRHQTSPPTTSH